MDRDQLFDFNGDGRMDMLEFLMGTGEFDPNSPQNEPFQADPNISGFVLNDSPDDLTGDPFADDGSHDLLDDLD